MKSYVVEPWCGTAGLPANLASSAGGGMAAPLPPLLDVPAVGMEPCSITGKLLLATEPPRDTLYFGVRNTRQYPLLLFSRQTFNTDFTGKRLMR